MSKKFDLFKIEQTGRVLWRAMCESLEEAKSQAATFSKIEQADYLIYDLTTGAKITVPFSPKKSGS